LSGEKNDRVVITVVGADKVGIVAAISRILAEHNANIVDISQTLMQDLFTMIMLVDISALSQDLKSLTTNLEQAGEQLGVKVMVQHENIFRFMHRV